MTDQTNADLIAEIKQWMSDHSHFHSARRRDVTRLLAALEAAEQERDNWKLSAEEAMRAEKRWKDRAHDYSTEHDALAAVVEKVREWAGSHSGSTVSIIRSLLATAPADALREVKAAVWAEGHDAGWEDRHQDALAGRMPSDSYESEAVNPYRAREGQDHG